MRRENKIRTVLSAGALLCIVARIVFPEVKIDAVTLGLLVVGILPWLSELLESAEFPGGWKVKFRDLQEAAAQIVHGEAVELVQRDQDLLINPQDASLSLVGLRIEIEKRLRRIAAASTIDPKLPLRALA